MKIVTPSSWNELTWKQLVHVWELVDKYSNDKTMLTLQVWLYLSELEFVKDETRINERGETMYLLQSIHKKKQNEWLAVTPSDLYAHLNGIHFTEEQRQSFIAIAQKEANIDRRSALEKELGLPFKPQAVDIHQWDERRGIMEWVLEPHTLTALPLDYIRVGRKRFMLPSPEFMSLSWQQYTNCQKLINAYVANVSAEVKKKKEELEGKIHADTTTQQHNDTLLYRFLAHLLVPSRLQFFTLTNGSFQLHVGKTYTYRVKDAEANVRRMHRLPSSTIRILLQYFQSCQELMRRKDYFPELFTGGGNDNTSAPIINEVNTINAIMKWEGTYPTQQDVYDANALNILGNLKDMAKEAKEVEKMTAKTKR